MLFIDYTLYKLQLSVLKMLIFLYQIKNVNEKEKKEKYDNL